jgi:hypothetical protein
MFPWFLEKLILTHLVNTITRFPVINYLITMVTQSHYQNLFWPFEFSFCDSVFLSSRDVFLNSCECVLSSRDTFLSFCDVFLSSRDNVSKLS